MFTDAATRKIGSPQCTPHRVDDPSLIVIDTQSRSEIKVLVFLGSLRHICVSDK